MRKNGLPQGWRAARYKGMLRRMEEAARLTEEELRAEREEEIDRMWGRNGSRRERSAWPKLDRQKRTRHRPWVISQDAIARVHGAEVVYLAGGKVMRPLSVDLLVWTVRELLGYRQGPPVWVQPRLGRAVREVLLHWPPMEFAEAVHEVVWQYGCDVTGHNGGGRGGLTVGARLQRARGLLEGWQGSRLQQAVEEGAGERAAS